MHVICTSAMPATCQTPDVQETKLEHSVLRARTERCCLEEQFLLTLDKTLQTSASALRPIVLRLISLGATKSELIRLAVRAGYNQTYVRTILSRILINKGCRQRKTGAGPKTPALALLVLAFAREKAGANAAKILRAAAHAA